MSLAVIPKSRSADHVCLLNAVRSQSQHQGLVAVDWEISEGIVEIDAFVSGTHVVSPPWPKLILSRIPQSSDYDKIRLTLQKCKHCGLTRGETPELPLIDELRYLIVALPTPALPVELMLLEPPSSLVEGRLVLF